MILMIRPNKLSCRNPVVDFKEANIQIIVQKILYSRFLISLFVILIITQNWIVFSFSEHDLTFSKLSRHHTFADKYFYAQNTAFRGYLKRTIES